MSNLPDRFLALDEEGYALQGDVRWNDPILGREVLEHLALAENGALVSRAGGVPVIIEAFDDPLVVQSIDRQPQGWLLHCPYEYEIQLSDAAFEKHLSLDEWDRFHGRDERGRAFVLSRKAQARFFDLLDDSDDTSIEINGRRIEVSSLWTSHQEVENESWWTNVYHEEKNPGWNLGAPAEALSDMLPRLRLRRSRVLVAGCGEGHDAAFFAREGHFVTAVDVSPEAIRRARAQYGSIGNLQFLEADLFAMGPEHDAAYDIIFEHTCFCAINPARRGELTQRWWRWLAPGGHLMGVFFTMDKPKGPPFGATEWEIRERLRKNYRFIFWGRWRQSVPRRQGKELFVYANKM